MARCIAFGVFAIIINASRKRPSLAFQLVTPTNRRHCFVNRIICKDVSLPPEICSINSFNFAIRSHPYDLSDSDQTKPLALDDDDFSILPASPQSSTWRVEDDWSALSAASTAYPALTSTNDQAFSSAFKIMDDADRVLIEHDGILGECRSHAEEWGSSLGNDQDRSSSAQSVAFIKDDADKEDRFVDDAIEAIATHLDYDDTVPLYDTKATEKTMAASNEFVSEDDHDAEIAFMVRCNQTPDNFLVSQGKALPELTDELKYSADFLFQEKADASDCGLSLQPKMTPFFKNAVQKIFHEYSASDSDIKLLQVMDRSAISSWMTKCLSFQQKPTRQTEDLKIGPYDKSINAFLSRYCVSSRPGRLTLDEFLGLYLESAWVGYINDARKKKEVMFVNGRFHPVPSMDESVIIKDRKSTEIFLKEASLSVVWRDLEAHGIFSPAEEERVRLMMEIQSLGRSHAVSVASRSDMIMDECELYDAYEDRLSNIDFLDGNESGPRVDFLQKKDRSSHELVEMSFDGETPKRLRDGEFVFIDEHSCIGCSQCAMIAPGSFKMIEDTGRARTFYQRNTDDIEHAVSSCPVNCMHMVSFDELKEMERSRDEGDGFGGARSHVPLHVAGRDSDANNKSSWYHYLKAKCGSTSCPQRGCYDCPSYLPGKNPYFQMRHKKAEHIRATDFIASGDAQQWRKTAEI